MVKKFIVYGLFAVLLSIAFLACTEPVTIDQDTYKPVEQFDPKKDVGLKTFTSEAEFASFVSSNYERSYASYGLYKSAVAMDIAGGVAGMAMDSEESAMPVPYAQDLDYSGTNVQVQDVDEADIIKTDGNYIYTVSGNTLFIIKAYPGEDAEIVSKLVFDNAPRGLYISGDYLGVFGSYYDYSTIEELGFVPRYGMSYFDIYDVKDHEEPELVKEYKFEGQYFQSRMVDDYVYFITTTGMQARPIYPTPVILEDNIARAVPVRDIYYYSLPYDSPIFANIHAIRMDAPGTVKSKSVAVEGSQNMYMSQNNIFITYTEYINEWEIQKRIMIEIMEPRLTAVDKALIEKIKNTDNDVLSQAEKEAKILQIIESYAQYLDSDEQDELEEEADKRMKEELAKFEYGEYTIIHKISVDDGEIDIEDTGKVPGHVINQFSMDEHKGYLRIATTINPRWSRWIEPMPMVEVREVDVASDEMIAPPQPTESINNIFVLDSDMDVVGELMGLAEGESIYSTRFMGDRVYMVTFRQVDPFFVIDLSDPEDPEVLGKLKIPGFSRYLHPYDENTIIGIGRDATDTGRTQGLKISLFDVTDVSDPEEVAKWVSEGKYSQSTAEYEHKAFLFSKEKKLLVIPAYSYDWDDDEGYNGALVFKIDKDDIELRGLIDHSSGGQYRYGPAVERSLYIEELLYTKSYGLLRINKLSDLSKVKNIELEPDKDGPYVVY